MKNNFQNKIKIKEKVIFLMIFSCLLSGMFLLRNNFKRNDFNVIKPAYAKDKSTDDIAKKKKSLKNDIEDLNKQLKKKEKQKKVLEQNLGSVQRAAYLTKQVIDNTQKQIQKTQKDIEKKEKEIELLEKNEEQKILILKKMMREMYERKQQPFIYILLEKNNFLDTATSVDNFLRMKEKILSAIGEIKQTREEIDRDKKELSEMKSKKEDLLAQKVKQKKVLDNQKYGLQIQVKEKVAGIQKIQRKLNKLRSSLARFLGKSININDIVDAVKFASKRTGVRKEFLMAMLDKESDLGRFTGGCTYKNTRVKSSEKKIFKEICKELGYNYKKRKISCSLSYGYGGAMGVAQFMPSTWQTYKKSIAGYTGHNPPDPWNLLDGVVGMAEKLRRAGANKKSGEHYAAKLYYCGGPGSAYWNTHCEAYADTVKSWSRGYDEYFK